MLGISSLIPAIIVYKIVSRSIRMEVRRLFILLTSKDICMSLQPLRESKTEERRPGHQIHNPMRLAYEFSQEMNNLSIPSKLHLVHFSTAKKSKNYFKTIFIETTLSLPCSSSFCSSPHSSEKAIRAAAATVRTHSNYRELAIAHLSHNICTLFQF